MRISFQVFLTRHPAFAQRLKQLLTFFFLALFYIFAITVTGVGCPIRRTIGLPCPGCGMSRAFFSLLRLDFRQAYHYHPLIFLAPFAALFYLFFPERTSLQKTIRKAAAVLLACLSIVLWLYRLLLTFPQYPF